MNNERIVAKEIIQQASQTKDLDEHKLNLIKKQVAKKHNYKQIMTNIKLLTYLSGSQLKKFKQLFITKPTRTISGVAVISIMAEPRNCPHGRCIYCPAGLASQFGDVPQSYTGKEPATMRAIRNNYDPYLQIMNRLEQYIVIGQSPEKIELIIMGGTFPSYPKKYRDDFIYFCFKAMNDFSKLFYKNKQLGLQNFKRFFELPGEVNDKERTKKIIKKLLKQKRKNTTLKQEQENNENATIKCVGLTIETKPDYGTKKIGKELLKYGCTRIELGIQTTSEKILKKINRGYTTKQAIKSIKELKDLGFKLNFHMMPGLPGVNKKQDITNLKKLFSDPNYRPDMLKIYPTMLFPETKLYDLYKKNKYKPITTKQAMNIIKEFKKSVPRYCRIMRVQRDIPTKLGKGVKLNNLRQFLQQQKDYHCECIRCREIKNNQIKQPVEFEIIKYDASKGTEYFISLKDANDKLIGFARLRFPEKNNLAIIRELHVYGTALPVGQKDINQTQHKSYGKQLMQKAESIAKQNNKKKILVISGIGVKEYYKKLGYKKLGSYMAKTIK